MTLEKIADYLTRHAPDMYRLLADLVNIQSGSRNISGVNQVCRRIRQEMEAMGCVCQTIDQADYGSHLVARYLPGTTPEKPILLSGHMDTVFPADTAFTTYWEDDTRCLGPGTADMKGGLVVGIFAMKALIHAKGSDTPALVFIFNSDEEIGSPSSRNLILDLARRSSMGFVLEAGGLSGEIVTARKGNLSVRIDVTGEAGHAAFAGRDKASAILDLAHKTIAIEALHQPDQGICANVGMVEGGIGPNTIAQHARAAVDFRFSNDSDRIRLMADLDLIMDCTFVPRTRSGLTPVSQRAAMPETDAGRVLFHQIKKIGEMLDITVTSEQRQGVSDANIIARAGIPVIDGLGPMGARDHSPDEYIIKQSLLDRTLLFAHILARIQTPTQT